MNHGFTLASVPIACQTGIYADSKTGRKLIWDEKDKCFLVDDRKKSPVNKKTLKPIFTETIVFSPGKGLVYNVYKAEKINRRGLNFEDNPVFSATIGKDGSCTEHGEHNLAFWLKDPNQLVVKNLLISESPVLPDQVCRSLFCWPSAHVLGTADDLDRILQLASTNGLKEKLRQLNDFRSQKFGVEVEFTGITRRRAAEVIAKQFQAEVSHTSSYDTYIVKDSKGRKWKILRDSSITPQKGKQPINDDDYKCELVTPVCSYDELKPVIQPLIRELRHAGAKVNTTCGIHVHIDSDGHTASTIRHLSNFMAAHEDLLYKALDVNQNRLHYCKKTDLEYLRRLNGQKIRTMDDISRAWYDGASRSSTHYDGSRYASLNLHSMFGGKGLEFRCFNGTLHAGKIRAYVELCMAISGHAKIMKRSTPHVRYNQNELIAMRNFMTTIGLTGDDFKTARLHLTTNLKKYGVNIAA